MTHSETQSLFCTDTRSSSLGVAEVGTLKLDLRVLKCQDPIFFLEHFFNTLESCHNYENPVGSIDTLIYTSELILCSSICVHSATWHNTHMKLSVPWSHRWVLFQQRASFSCHQTVHGPACVACQSVQYNRSFCQSHLSPAKMGSSLT